MFCRARIGGSVGCLHSIEKMCAYELIECASDEEAIEVASSHTMAKVATIEVRAVWNELAAR